MQSIRVSAAVLNQTPLDWDGNRDRIVRAIRMAREQNASILCLPEMCIPGYGCDDMFHSPAVIETGLEVLGELLPETEGLIVCFGLPLMVQKAVFNTVCLVADGEVLGFTAKKHLAGDGIHYEHRWFKPWPEDQVSEVEFEGESHLVGDLLYEVGGVRIGFEICEDAWVARRPGTDLALQGVDLILNPSASHFAFGKTRVRERFVIEGSRAFAVGYVYANLLGNSSGRAIYDGDAIIASGGELLARGSRFGYDDVRVTEAVVEIDRNRMMQSQQGGYRPDFSGEIGECVITEFEFPDVLPEPPPGIDVPPEPDPGWESSVHRKEEEFTRAVSLALFDYLRKSFSRGFVVSLSGGADSTAVACLCSLMVDLAVADLGLEGVLRKLSHLPNRDELNSIEALKSRLLLTAYQATRNSSATTENAAATVANAVGATHLVLDVDPMVEHYKRAVSDAIGRELTWEQDDLTLQNIQARGRGPSVWMLANIRGSLLLSTSNRSEAAVGYATMDGDTCGGLSPIAGIDKAFLRRWLVWLEETGPVGRGPIPQVHAVNRLEPTAELRPSETDQTDEGDLMPYELLDAIERAAIRDKRSPLDVYRLMRAEFDYGSEQLLTWVERFYGLWCRNQWKRERYAPSFHVDDKNLDPKTWCRFPILSGGFRRELAVLRRFVAENNAKSGTDE